MIAYARMALPKMVASVLLAAPLMPLAGPAFADPARHAASSGNSGESTGSDLRPIRIASLQGTDGRVRGSSERATASRQRINEPAEESVWTQTGIASWYGEGRWNGQPTSSGSRFNAEELTAAHASLPFGTRVKVRLVNSDRSVVVVINDRPGTRRRIIDLSRAAARELGILNQGIATVTLSRI